MRLIMSALMALSVGLYELPPVTYTSGVEGAKQAAFEVENYLGRVREIARDAHMWGDISDQVWAEYDFLDKNACHYHHLFVMSILFYEEAPVEDPYGRLVTKASFEMAKRLILIKAFMEREGLDILIPKVNLFVNAYAL